MRSANDWVVDMSVKAPAAGIAFVIDSKKVVNATPAYGQARPDVVQALGPQSTLLCGFLQAEIPTAGLAKGTHTIQLWDSARTANCTIRSAIR
jgi:hypothetical protein